jgi:hypothetical protein
MPDTKGDQEAAVFLLVFLVEPAGGVVNVVILAPDRGVVVEDVV